MKWLIFGAGAQGRICRESIATAAPGSTVMFVDDFPERSPAGRDGSILDRRAASLRMAEDDFVGLIAVGDNATRLRLAHELENEGWRFGVLVHPAACVAPSASLGPGTAVMAGAIIQSGASVAAHVIVNSGAILEHDSSVEAGASLSPGCATGGRVRIGAQAFVGTGAVLCPRVEVGRGSIVGAGAVVTKSLPAGVVAFGNPARVIRPVDAARDWRRLL